MGEALEFSAQTQFATQLGCHGSHGENTEGTDCDTFLLAFAAIPVDDRPEKTRRLLAFRFLVVHYSFPGVKEQPPQEFAAGSDPPMPDQPTGCSTRSGSLLTSEYWML